VEAGGVTGLIGPNGAGKTTLCDLVSGVSRLDPADIRFDGQSISGWRPDPVTRAGLVRTFQIAHGFRRLSALENLLLYGPRQPGERMLPAITRPSAARRRDDVPREQALAIGRRLSLYDVRDNRAAGLSGGQKSCRRLAAR